MLLLCITVVYKEKIRPKKQSIDAIDHKKRAMKTMFEAVFQTSDVHVETSNDVNMELSDVVPIQSTSFEITHESKLSKIEI